jgi:excisionase family DNA binding protein
LSTVISMATNRAVYTVEETAEILGMGRTRTYEMVRAGEIPARKLGNRWVIPKARFHDWLNDVPTGETDPSASAQPDASSHLRRVSGDEVRH